MDEALTYIYKIYDAFITWIFGAELFQGVSLGWIFVSIFIMGLIIKNLLNIPKSQKTFNFKKDNNNGN